MANNISTRTYNVHMSCRLYSTPPNCAVGGVVTGGGVNSVGRVGSVTVLPVESK